MRKYVAAFLIGSALSTMAVASDVGQKRTRGGSSSQSDDSNNSGGGGFARSSDRGGWSRGDSGMSSSGFEQSAPRKRGDGGGQRPSVSGDSAAPASVEGPRARRGERPADTGAMTSQSAEQPRSHKRGGDSASDTSATRATGFDQRLQEYRAKHGRDAALPKLPESIASKKWGEGRARVAAPVDTRIQRTRLVADNHIKQMFLDKERWKRERERYRYDNWWMYHLPGYYDPYGYSYRSWYPGYMMWSSYYGRDYWLDDPQMWMLPQVYGPYRWVRYWDDAILVNVYTGQVVDVYRNFFW